MNWSQHFLGILELVFDKYDLTQKWTDLINFLVLSSGMFDLTQI